MLNEPETSLHPDLLPALARLIARAATHSQVSVASHAALEWEDASQSIVPEKHFGTTRLADDDERDLPPWKWPAR